MKKIIQCDFCENTNLKFCYQPQNSKRDTKVYVCLNCSLVQSTTSDSYKKKPREKSISSGADWGNIRHGKGIRFEPNKNFILQHLQNRQNIENILDIGSNRGDFVLQAKNLFSNVRQIVGVEPDVNIVSNYLHNKEINVILESFENLTFQDNSFDFIYSSHTLEHSKSAKEMLIQSHKYLKIGGMMFLEIPNIETLYDKNTVEEFFIDKHSFHFERNLLCNLLNFIGFDVIASSDNSDIYNLSLLLKKKEKNRNGIDLNSASLGEDKVKLIEEYKNNLIKNRNKLKAIACLIEKMTENNNVAFWGGGRIFDALVRYGDLKTDRVLFAIDEFIGKYVTEFHGVKIMTSNNLNEYYDVDIFIVLARSSELEIAKKIYNMGYKKVKIFSELFSEC
jgi:2-polyprenyl-3-methyl-5-hydroxy-6-metoxy-1,4-benzoquinol methylase